jgi:membrane fusion protein (multidrug efflux system)
VKRTTSVTTLLLLLIPLALTACGGSGGGANAAQASTTPAGATLPDETKAEEDQDAITVAVGAVRREPLSSLYSTSATLRADKRATITARTTGVVKVLLVEEGDRVETGEPLAELENDEQKISFQRASTARDTLMRDFERARRLHEDGLVSDEEFETNRREAEDAQHAAALAELELSRTIIKSPFSGIILTRHIDVGATVSDGTAVYDLADLEPLYADVNVPERHVVHLSPGQQVRLTADARALVIPALIERIAPVVDPSTGTVKVTLAVSGESSVRPGAFVRVDIVTDTHGEALVVPRPALVAEGRRWLLFRMDEGDRVKQLEVQLGYEEGDRVEILEVLEPAGALVPGTPIVVAGAPALTDGALVRVIENGQEETDSEDDAVVTP